MKNKLTLIFLGLILCLAGQTAFGQAKMITPKKLSGKIGGGNNVVIIDLRTDDEVAEGMIEGAIQLDYYGDGFADRIQELDKSKNYYVYCKSGGRSAKAAQHMADQGFNRIFDLEGGITQWKAEGYELKKDQ